jgi:UDP-glucuronate 4-epimerase
MRRDFTYIDDVVWAIAHLIGKPPNPETTSQPALFKAPRYKLYNVGNNRAESLLHFVKVLEEHIGKEANRTFKPLQPGDMLETFADIHDIAADIGYAPQTRLEEGLRYFVDWYRSYYAAG